MDNNLKSTFHFPREVYLEKNSLVEAWLDVRWELEESNIPNFLVDKTFPFALGVFFEKVRDRYPFIEELDASKAPEGMTPHIPHYRFRVKQGGWPLLQLGPGLATLNFTKSYNWNEFKKESLYLQSQLLSAYKIKGLNINSLSLTYRNTYPCESSLGHFQEFLAEKLNSKISLPKYIPGKASEIQSPVAANLFFNYKLVDPPSMGILRIATGVSKEDEVLIDQKIEVIIWEFVIKSRSNELPNFMDKESFSNWLEKAHSIIHEWFLSSIEGSIFAEFKGSKE